eukprot:gene570-316_t
MSASLTGTRREHEKKKVLKGAEKNNSPKASAFFLPFLHHLCCLHPNKGQTPTKRTNRDVEALRREGSSGRDPRAVFEAFVFMQQQQEYRQRYARSGKRTGEGEESWSGASEAALRLSSGRRLASLSAVLEPRRGYINVLYRTPPEHTIPTHAPSGEEIDSERFLYQLQEFLKMLKMTQLIDALHDMKNFPYYECIFARDLLFQHFDLLLPMPKVGKEHRVAEINETLRYMRGCGATVDFHHVLQDTKGCRASGRDFISTQHGILMGWSPGGNRTNKIAMETLTGATAATEADAASVKVLAVEPIELYPDSPPLSDIAAIAGMRSLLVSDDKHGFRAAEQIVHRMPKVHWQVIKMPVGCSFLSHWAGAKYCYDVMCDQDFPEGLERLGETGLNPFPVDWSEPRKLGVTMASVCFVANFSRGSMSGGGFADNTVHHHSDFNYNSRNTSSNPRLFADGRRRHGDSGPGIEAQLRSGEIYEPQYQAPPRYAPPMHGDGSGQVILSDRNDKVPKESKT